MATEDTLTDISSKLDGIDSRLDTIEEQQGSMKCQMDEMNNHMKSLRGTLKSDRTLAGTRHNQILEAIQEHAEAQQTLLHYAASRDIKPGVSHTLC